MDEFIQGLVAAVAAAGGTLGYPALLEATPFEQRRLLPNALKAARAQGLLHQTVALVDGAIVHNYHSGPAPE